MNESSYEEKFNKLVAIMVALGGGLTIWGKREMENTSNPVAYERGKFALMIGEILEITPETIFPENKG